MGRITLSQKCQRVLRFFIGLRVRRVAGMLAAYGFDDHQLDEGWRLLRNVTGGRLGAVGRNDPALITQLDEWENRWFVVADATLRRHNPAVADAVFLNLSRTTGPEVIVSVSTFIDRLDALGDGEDAKAARARLAQRGLNEAVLAEARTLLGALTTVQVEEPTGPLDEAGMLAAEEELWGWYLEWSAIARMAIPDRRMLALLGFTRTTARSSAAEETEEDDKGDEGDEAPASEEGGASG
jgi:hypothetical protein